MFRIFFVLGIFIGIVEACTGDCAQCHQNLDYQNDLRHISMLGCKECHTDAKMAQIDMGGCGKDCFACHDTNKLRAPHLASSHQMIDACIQCHTSLSQSPISTGENVFQKGIQNFSNGFGGFDKILE